MAQSKHEIQSLLAEAGTQPRHRFGQNFMIDQNLVRLVAEAGQIAPEDLVIEVGPGTGTLTEEILSRGPQVIAVEIDRDLSAMLRGRFGANPRFALIEGDALAGKHELNEELLKRIHDAHAAGQRVKLVANLPYNIASPLIIELLLAGVSRLAFTVQKEVADRLRAQSGSDAYGGLSVMSQLLARVEVLRVLPPQAFWPAPAIDSALVSMVRDDRLGETRRNFSSFVQSLFSARRKTLRKALVQMNLDPDRVLSATGIEPSLRPENLSPEQFFSLFQASRAQ
jgi:16S rRNA (adenine1518-N6/adenine1519-N6)-dimethyltransferase